jgi:hypothetical protein
MWVKHRVQQPADCLAAQCLQAPKLKLTPRHIRSEACHLTCMVPAAFSWVDEALECALLTDSGDVLDTVLVQMPGHGGDS